MTPPTTYAVLIGAPSWHQRRAGATCSSVYAGFQTQEDAERFAAVYLAKHPDAPVHVAPDTTPRKAL